MRQHFGLDRLIEHGSLPLPETTLVVNPEYRRGSQELRRERNKLQRLQAQLGAHTLPPQATPKQIQEFETTGGELQAKVEAQETQINLRKKQQKGLARKVELKTLPQDQRFRQLCPESKHFIDTIKMIAYRAESALAGELGESLQRTDDVRSLLRRAFVTPANLRPDYQNQTLTVELHRLGSPLQDAALAKLCAELTATETQFPTTNLKLVYRQVGSA